MTDDELFARLQDKPALRFCVARTEEETRLALEQYRRDYDCQQPSFIRTANTRAELRRLLEEP